MLQTLLHVQLFQDMRLMAGKIKLACGLLGEFRVKRATLAVTLWLPLCFLREAGANDTSGESPLDEVIVTARKREEQAEQTPVSMATATARDIENRNLATLVELGSFTPGANFSQAPLEGSPLSSAFFIRGIGQLDYAPTMEAGVGLYVDNVYIGRSPGAVLDLADIQQVEILKGPQGTLFGKNTIGGAINVTTKAPSFDRWSGSETLTLGDRQRLNGDVDVNVPINSSLAARIAVGYRSKGGFVNRPNANQRGGEDNTVVAHGKLAARLSDDNLLTLAADYTRTDAAKPVKTIAAFDSSPAIVQLFNALIGTPSGNPLTAANSLSPNDRTDLSGSRDHTDFKGGGASAQLEHDGGSWSLRSVSAYRALKSRNQRDNDGSVVDFNREDYLDRQHQWSEELDLFGKNFEQRLHWTVGFYYFHEIADSRYQYEIAPGLFSALEALPDAVIPLSQSACPGAPACAGGAGNPLNTQFDFELTDLLHVRSRSVALFADSEWAFTPRLAGFAGVRYTSDSKAYSASIARNASGTYYVAPTSVPEKTWNKASPRVGFKWQAGDELMLYASISQGFKAGGFNPRPGNQAAARQSFDPEELWAYELGVKGDFAQHRLRVNASLFHYDYKDLQLLAAEILPGDVLTSEVIDNVGKARIDGVEAEVLRSVGAHWVLQAGASYLHAKYLDSATAVTGISKDTPLIKTPRLTGAAAVQYQTKLRRGTVLLRVDYSYTSANHPDVRATPALEQRAHGLVNGRAAWASADEHWALALYGKNLFDTRYIENGFDARNSTGTVIAVPSQPRELGVRITHRY